MKAIRWTDEQLEAYSKRTADKPPMPPLPKKPTTAPKPVAIELCDDHYSKGGSQCVLPKYHDGAPEYKIFANTISPIPPMPPKGKYGSVKTHGYASKKEAKRAAELKLLEQAGAIANLREQVKYELIAAQYIDGKCVERAVTYVADFVYERDGVTVVSDVKGYRTPVYRLKRKLMLWILGIRIEES